MSWDKWRKPITGKHWWYRLLTGTRWTFPYMHQVGDHVYWKQLIKSPNDAKVVRPARLLNLLVALSQFTNSAKQTLFANRIDFGYDGNDNKVWEQGKPTMFEV